MVYKDLHRVGILDMGGLRSSSQAFANQKNALPHGRENDRRSRDFAHFGMEGKWMIDRLFFEHPRSVGETYRQHFGVAAGVGLVMLGTAFALFVHALVPALFTRTGSATIKRLYGKLKRRQPLLGDQAPAYATQDWRLEYEI